MDASGIQMVERTPLDKWHLNKMLNVCYWNGPANHVACYQCFQMSGLLLGRKIKLGK